MHPSKVYNSVGFNVFTELCTRLHNQLYHIFNISKGTSYPSSFHPSQPSPSPRPLPNYFLSLFLTFHINEIVPNVVFRDGLQKYF